MYRTVINERNRQQLLDEVSRALEYMQGEFNYSVSERQICLDAQLNGNYIACLRRNTGQAPSTSTVVMIRRSLEQHKQTAEALSNVKQRFSDESNR